MNNLVVLIDTDFGIEEIVLNKDIKKIEVMLNYLEQKRIEECCDIVTVCLCTNNIDDKIQESFYSLLKENIKTETIKLGLRHNPKSHRNDEKIIPYANDNDLNFKNFVDIITFCMIYPLNEVLKACYISSLENIDDINSKLNIETSEHNFNRDYQKEATIFECVENKGNIIDAFKHMVKYDINDVTEDKKKENAIIIFLDIDGNINLLDNENAFDLKDAIKQKMRASNASKAIISLVSNTSDDSYIKWCIEHLNCVLDDEIIGIEHYSNNGVYINNEMYKKYYPNTTDKVPLGDNKSNKIINTIKRLLQIYNIKWVSYFDDEMDYRSYDAIDYIMSNSLYKVDLYALHDMSLDDKPNINFFKKQNVYGVIDGILSSIKSEDKTAFSDDEEKTKDSVKKYDNN